MSFTPIGDLARMLQFRQDQGALRQRLTQASTEMSTGRRRDIPAALGGDLAVLAGIERSDRMSAAHLRAAGLAAAQATALQAGLETMEAFSTGYGAQLAGVIEQALPSAMTAEASTAQRNLETVVNALNLRVGDRYLLSGTSSDSRPLPEASALLSELRSLTSGLATAAEVVQVVDDWFAAPAGGGGFVDFYQGDGGPAPGIQIAEGQTVNLGMTATEDAFRRVLSGLALTSLIGDASLAPTVQAAGLLKAGADRLIGASDGLADLRGRLGSTEAAIETSAARTRATAAAMALMRETLIGVDPADAASEVIAVQGQLETLYALTARVQQMSLVNYL